MFGGLKHTIRRPRPNEPHRPRHNRRNQQLVIEHRRPPVLVRVNLHVLLLLLIRLPLVVVGGPVPELPARVPRLGVVELSAFVPVWARGLHGEEVRVRVALDVGFGVEVALWLWLLWLGVLSGVLGGRAGGGGHGWKGGVEGGVLVTEGMGVDGMGVGEVEGSCSV